MDGQIVEHHDVARSQRRHEHLFDIGEERGVVDRPVEDRRRLQAVPPQRGDHRVGLPVPARRVIAEPQTPRAATVAPEQISRDTGLVKKNVMPRIAQRLRLFQRRRAAATSARRCSSGIYRFF